MLWKYRYILLRIHLLNRSHHRVSGLLSSTWLRLLILVADREGGGQSYPPKTFEFCSPVYIIIGNIHCESRRLHRKYSVNSGISGIFQLRVRLSFLSFSVEYVIESSPNPLRG
uniref:Uncharacterized protein n=1 Tax=Ophiognomonia clavigignenti-juglandacearum TaxID=218668 RepID=A0A291LJ42_9PEZI|nr:hypothetical protein [Ophiognomonia clavigignenti-juglandacearum]